MTKYTYVFIFVFAGMSICYSQSGIFENFDGLKSAGAIPEDFTKLSSTKYQEDLDQVDRSQKKRIQHEQDQFLLESNFLMDQLLHSGRVVFGDPVTQYLNAIKDIILKDDTKTKNEIRIYTYTSNEANAFTSDNGIVLVTTGLIAQCENEAQIAFVLCHEFNHYIKQHAINNYVENKEMEKGSGIYKNLDPEDIDLQKFRYSKDLESEADELGVKLYTKTNYSPAAVESVFDVLLYSYLPFDQVDYKKTLFNEGKYIIPDTYYLDSTATVTAESDYDDETSDHPNIKKRKDAALAELKGAATSGKLLFIQPESDFLSVRKICRYEACELYLNDIEYENALYQAYLLQTTDADNLYLKKVTAKSLYGLSIYKNHKKSPDWALNYKDIEGTSQQVYYVFDKMPAKELNILALKYAWAVHKADASDEQINDICNQLASEIGSINKLQEKDFKTAEQAASDTTQLIKDVKTDDTKTTDNSTKSTTKTTSSKYDKIKKEQEKTESNYWTYAFTDYLNDKEFTDLYNTSDTKKTTASKNKKSSSSTTSGNKNAKGPDDEYALGVKDIVVVNPLYIKINEKSDNPVKYEAAEDSRLALKDKIYECANLLDMDISYLEPNNLAASDVDKFNDLSILNNWLSEKLDHEDEGLTFINSNSDELIAMAKKYKVNNFVWMGIINFKEKEHYVGGKILYALVLWPTAPFIIYDLAKPDYTTYFFTLVVNAQTNKIDMEFFNAADAKDTNAIQKSNIYYILKQIESKQ